MLLVLLWLVVLAIVAVQIIHPINEEISAEGLYDGCERCSRAYSSVSNTLVTFTQTLIAGDSWGQSAILVIERQPFTYVYFIMALATVACGIMNLMLAAIVDAAAEARKKSTHELAREKEKELRQASEYLVDLCKALDTDESGCLTVEELKKGMTENQEFADTMAVMDINPADIDIVFKVLDEDGSGDVDYNEFADRVYKMKASDSQTMLVMIRHYVKTMHDTQLAEMELLVKSEMGTLHSQLTEVKSELDIELAKVSELAKVLGNDQSQFTGNETACKRALSDDPIAAADTAVPALPAMPPSSLEPKAKAAGRWYDVEGLAGTPSIQIDLDQVHAELEQIVAATSADIIRLMMSTPEPCFEVIAGRLGAPRCSRKDRATIAGSGVWQPTSLCSAFAKPDARKSRVHTGKSQQLRPRAAYHSSSSSPCQPDPSGAVFQGSPVHCPRSPMGQREPPGPKGNSTPMPLNRANG
jgi:hypothetical protein